MNDKVIINAVGDVWFGDHPVCIGHGVRSTAARFGPGFLFEEVAPLLEEGDFNFCNLESVLSDHGLRPWLLPSLEMRGSPECIEALRAARFNVVNVANNHAMQHGLEAFNETVELLGRHEISVVGIDRDGRAVPLITKKGSVEVAFIGFSMHEELYCQGDVAYSYRRDPAMVVKAVADLRKQFDGFIVCSLHWGDEYIHRPSPEQVGLAHKLVDSGVDVLLGHHPHVLQGIERYRRGIIFYSLGNFIFDLWMRPAKKTVMARIELASGKTPTFSAVPIWINDNYQPTPATGDDEREIEADLAAYARMIPSPGDADASALYRQEAVQRASEFRHDSYRYFARNVAKYPVGMLAQSVLRTVGRRLLFR